MQANEFSIALKAILGLDKAITSDIYPSLTQNIAEVFPHIGIIIH